MWRVWETYGGRISGILTGLFFFFIYVWIGFWDMLFCALLVGLAFWIGKQKDEKRGPLFPWERLTEWVTERWPGPR
ncbi:hypothetical protein SD71_19945 [Cohnella kolymensis]|uniref:DUF2273 domain-containing protein n=1 Tax=Cohnella kolymensis TaxID=1590652 RepID=A0ABR4ZZT0_9BACL|nr:DUF2273 domain-containing protein [Cohnella kolymensis]KIL34322.1 hypothetical protein SD71_19945 [Cohnella kolymensis]